MTERCDGCNSDAVMATWAVTTKAGEVVLCDHHFRKHRAHIILRRYRCRRLHPPKRAS